MVLSQAAKIKTIRHGIAIPKECEFFETKPRPNAMNKTTMIHLERSEGGKSIAGTGDLTVELSDAHADVRTWHVIFRASAPARCQAADAPANR